jgi:hypothetical protein
MDRILDWVEYFRAHPLAAAGVLVAVVVAYVVLNRKPKYVQEADQQLSILRRERKTKYDELQPPR